VRRREALLVAALVLTGCASLSPPPADALTGRLSVRVEGTSPRSVSASFDLRGDATRGELNLSTPIGTTLAQARWQPGDVRLLTPDGEQRFADLDALTREVLGESLPLAALFDWLRGRPWEGAPSRPMTPGSGFEQLGWQVDLARYADGQIDARRLAAPAVVVRARLDSRG
jgi:outer membrane lipoprotein LolB